MKHIWTILLMLALAQASFGQLSRPLSGTLGPGTYMVIGEIRVEADNTLTLMPATTFIFDGAYPFRIYGTLLAEGTESDSIVFTTDPYTNPNRWRSLCFWGSGSSASRLAYCLIEKGYSERGGGLWCYDHSSPTFMYCSMSDNSGGLGGGVMCEWYSSPTFVNCTVMGNSANGGGGVCCWSNSSPSFTNCTVSGNSASTGGGVFCSENCSPTFRNCILSDNHATGSGGGVGCLSNSSPTFTNCTLSGNSAYNDGGGVVCYIQASPSFVNCILWVNTPEQIFLNDGGSVQVSYSDVQGGWSGTGNINADPLFVSGPDGPYYLSQIIAGQGVQSPCVDTGDPSSSVIEGTTRTDGVQDAWPVDMGYHYRTFTSPPMNAGFVTLIHPGPTDWGYCLHWVSGSLSRLVFANFCSGTIGSVGGNAEAAGWAVANYSDSIVFTASTPLTSGTIDTFWLSHPYCSDFVTWQA
ncbi:MAG: right-handed parallel beta-helix repeat-containing protein, partial [Calditrichaeota bacterium]|nr:right-handed parallel beta-helix repeat-containing protein [Calditrichota bacterium]